MNGSLRGNYFIWEQLHISEQRYSYGDKLWKNQSSALNMYKLLGAKSGAFLE